MQDDKCNLVGDMCFILPPRHTHAPAAAAAASAAAAAAAAANGSGATEDVVRAAVGGKKKGEGVGGWGGSEPYLGFMFCTS
jgi:hypothetical protein